MNKLREFRLDAGFSITKLADKMGVHPSTICSWETEASHPQHYQIRRLAVLLGCEPDMLELTPAVSRRPNTRPEPQTSEMASILYMRFMELSLDEQRYILAYTTPEPYRTAVKRICEGRLTREELATITRMMGECGGI